MSLVTRKLVILNLWCIISDMDKSLIEVIKEWKEFDFKTGLILHVGDDTKNIKRRKYQKFINEQNERKWYEDIGY